MPTQRLSDTDKSWIESQFDQVLNRANNNKPFPVSEEDIPEWVFSTLPDSVAEAWKVCRQFDQRLVMTAGYYFNIEVICKDNIGKYYLRCEEIGNVPNHKPVIDEGSMWYEEVLNWCDETHALSEKVHEAELYLESAIYSCTSAGQIARILPDDCLRFVPNTVLSSLQDAERKSRIPRGFKPDEEKAGLLLDMLALGSISPEERAGPDVTIDTFRPTG